MASDVEAARAMRAACVEAVRQAGGDNADYHVAAILAVPLPGVPGLWHADVTCGTCGKVIDHHATSDRDCAMSAAMLMADAVWIHRKNDKCPCADGWQHGAWTWVETPSATVPEAPRG